MNCSGNNEAICLLDIKKYYKKNKITTNVLKGINLSINQGEMICIMGVSGSGKSTLLNIIAGLLPATSGEYYYDHNKLNINNYHMMEIFRHDKVGVILQKFALIEDLSVYENIALPLKYQKIPSKKIRQKVHSIMKELDLDQKEDYYPDELSGGQQQRVSIARALIKQPELVIADEPTGSLDEENTQKIMAIFQKLNQQGITIIIATHDTNIASLCHRTLFLKNGLIEEKGGYRS